MLTDHEVFWLARYAHNTLAPLFAEAKAIDPSLQYAIELNFADKDSAYYKYSAVGVKAHWNRAGMLIQESHKTTKADIDKLALQIKDKIARLQLDTAVAELESASV